MSRLFSCLLFLTIVLTACGSDQPVKTAPDPNGETVIYLSRHAEKAAGKNPGLLPAGKQRAQQLARRFGTKGITAVYATGYRRTQATAAPLAATIGVPVQTYSASDNPVKQTKKWLGKHRGQTIFVVGHSNTVPGLVNALVTGANYGDIDENDYDQLFRVSINSAGKGRVEALRSARQ